MRQILVIVLLTYVATRVAATPARGATLPKSWGQVRENVVKLIPAARADTAANDEPVTSEPDTMLRTTTLEDTTTEETTTLVPTTEVPTTMPPKLSAPSRRPRPRPSSTPRPVVDHHDPHHPHHPPHETTTDNTDATDETETHRPHRPHRPHKPLKPHKPLHPSHSPPSYGHYPTYYPQTPHQPDYYYPQQHQPDYYPQQQHQPAYYPSQDWYSGGYGYGLGGELGYPDYSTVGFQPSYEFYLPQAASCPSYSQGSYGHGQDYSQGHESTHKPPRRKPEYFDEDDEDDDEEEDNEGYDFLRKVKDVKFSPDNLQYDPVAQTWTWNGETKSATKTGGKQKASTKHSLKFAA